MSESIYRSRRRWLTWVVGLFVLLAVACGSDRSSVSGSANASSVDMVELSMAMDAAATEFASDSAESVVVTEAASASASNSSAADTKAVSDASEADAIAAAAEAESAAEAMSDAIDDAAEADPVAVDVAGASTYGRDVIYRAAIRVQAPDVAAAAREATAAVQNLGGIVFGQWFSSTPEHAEIVFKVPPDQFTAAMDRLAALGDLIDQQITAEDVTERIVDFESRILTSEGSVRRLRTFLEEATNIQNITRVEQELLNRETDLETLRGQLRTLKTAVGLATITLTIEPIPEPVVVVPASHMVVTAWAAADDDPCLGDQHLTVGVDATVRFCVEIENIGEVALTDVQIRSDALRIRPTDAARFIIAEGTFARVPPGGLVVATTDAQIEDGRLAGRVATRGVGVQFDVSATPVDDDGTAFDPLSTSVGVSVVATDDTPWTFNDAFTAGYDALSNVGWVLLLAAGILLPWSPLLVVVAALVWWRLRRRRRRHRAADAAQPVPDADTSDDA